MDGWTPALPSVRSGASPGPNKLQAGTLVVLGSNSQVIECSLPLGLLVRVPPREGCVCTQSNMEGRHTWSKKTTIRRNRGLFIPAIIAVLLGLAANCRALCHCREVAGADR
jgi:hypothetical protein